MEVAPVLLATLGTGEVGKPDRDAAVSEVCSMRGVTVTPIIRRFDRSHGRDPDCEAVAEAALEESSVAPWP